MIKKIKEKIKVMKKKRDLKKIEKKKEQINKEIKEEKLVKEKSTPSEVVPINPRELEPLKEEVEIPIPPEVVESPEKETEQPKEEPKKKGLVGQLAELNEKIDIISQKGKQEKKLKKKSFKLPFTVKSQLKKLAVKNKVQVMLLQRTRNILPVVGEIRDGMLIVGDNIFEGAVNYTWLWRGKYPTFIVPEWDLSPISKEGIDKMRGRPLEAGEMLKDTRDNQRSSEPQKIILRAIEAKENLMLKGKVSSKAIILAVVVTLIIAAVLFGGGVV